MAADAGQAGDLVLGGDEVLERAEGEGSQRKGSAQVEIAHIPFDEPGARLDLRRLLRQALPADRQHVRGQIQPDDLNAGTRGGDQHTPRAAADLQHRAAGRLRHPDEECHILPLSIRHDMIVKRRGETVFGVAAGLICHGRTLPSPAKQRDQPGLQIVARADDLHLVCLRSAAPGWVGTRGARLQPARRWR